MSLIEKIDAEIAEIDIEPMEVKNGRERDVWNNGYDRGSVRALKLSRHLILSEQKEPCKYCQGDIDNRKYLIRKNDELECYIDGSGNIDINDEHDFKINYCPMCGRPLNQPYTE